MRGVFEYEIDCEQRLIVSRCTGRFSLEALRTAVERLWSDGRYSSDYAGLVEIADPSATIAVQDLRSFIRFVRENARRSQERWAVVTTSPLATACAMLYREAMVGRHEFQVFSTREAACAWLKVKLPGAGELPLPGVV
jgi:hypothetical protein